MSIYLFPPPAVVAAAIRGRAELFPLRRIFCVGRNYEAHAREMGATADLEAPFYFNKAALDYVPSGVSIAYPPGTANFHYELELVVAIGSAGFRIDEAAALGHVYGYACGLDMTRRDLQAAAKAKQHPWDFGKDFDDSAVLSEIVPVDLIGHPAKGKIELKVNGVVKQSSDFGLLIHPVAALISYLSNYYPLYPGDLIYTGTPEGVGAVVPGDRLEGRIEGVGEISLSIGAGISSIENLAGDARP